MSEEDKVNRECFLVIVPTYNERENVERLCLELLDLDVIADLTEARDTADVLEVLEICHETGGDTTATGRIYYQISEAFSVPWVRRSTFAAAGDDRWEQRAAQVLSEDQSRSHRRLVVAAVTKAAGSNGRSEAVGDLLRGHAREVERFMDILEELKGEEAPSLAAVSVITRELAALADRLS